jgi:hypothetical protein
MIYHTPGPWCARSSIKTKTFIFAPSGRLVTEVRPDPGSRLVPEAVPISAEEARANADLIAAAPDMYAALHALLEHSACLNPMQGYDEFDHPAVKQAHAAIAKAEGA